MRLLRPARLLAGTTVHLNIPDDIYAQWSAVESGAKAEAEWNDLFNQYKSKYPELAKRV